MKRSAERARQMVEVVERYMYSAQSHLIYYDEALEGVENE